MPSRHWESDETRFRSLGLAITLTLAAMGCQPVQTAPAHAERLRVAPTLWPSADEIEEVRFETMPWRFGDVPGQIITTQHHRLHTTLHRDWVTDRMPLFLERSLLHYTSAITQLPPPRDPLDTYLFASRNEWEAKTRQILGRNAGPYLNLGRGGYTTRGIAVLYFLGRRDTLAITAHEGWHQYTQRTFRHQLPVWLEEGLATYMEGHVSEPGGRPRFLPWANLERYHTLRSAERRRRLLSMEQLISSHPEALLDRRGSRLLVYYAQLWGLIHYLMEGEGGRHRSSLQQMMLDAVGDQRDRSPLAVAGRDGRAVLDAYFTDDIEVFDAGYRAFVTSLIRTGGRDQIVYGRSPLTTAP